MRKPTALRLLISVIVVTLAASACGGESSDDNDGGADADSTDNAVIDGDGTDGNTDDDNGTDDDADDTDSNDDDGMDGNTDDGNGTDTDGDGDADTDGDGDTSDSSSDDNGDVVYLDEDDVELTSRLIRFGECDELLDYIHTEYAERVGPWGFEDNTYWGVGVPEARRMDTQDMAMAGVEESADSFMSPPPTGGDEVGSATNLTEGIDYSGTNVQEAGVDEADIVKTDGSRIFALSEGRLVVTDAASRKIVGSVKVAEGWSSELFISGDDLLLIQRFYPKDEHQAWDDYNRPETILQRISLTGNTPEITETLRIQGEYVSARSADGTARVIIRYNPQRQFPFVYPQGAAGEQTAKAANRAAVLDTTVADWLPRYTTDDTAAHKGQQLTACGNTHAPSVFSGFGVTVVMSVPMASGFNPANSTAVMAPGDTVYASVESLYLATTTWDIPKATEAEAGAEAESEAEAATETEAATEAEAATGAEAEAEEDSDDNGKKTDDRLTQVNDIDIGTSVDEIDIEPNIRIAIEPDQRIAIMPDQRRDRRTSIHRFSITDTANAVYEASGDVPGSIHNQFSLSEHEGHLRVVTTTGDMWAWAWRDDEGDTDPQSRVRVSQSQVRVLRQEGDRLIEVGSVGDIGKGERVQSVRFVGDIGYVVTFRQIDPFYTIDLSDPTDPRIRGELKIPGFSSYLHPISDDLVLGVGSDADDRGVVTGAKVSLFDVSDLDNPSETAVWSAPDGWNDIGWDHRAFLWWAPENLAVIPVSIYGGSKSWAGAVALRVTDGKIAEVGRIDHQDEDTAPGKTNCRRLTQKDLPSTDQPELSSADQPEQDVSIKQGNSSGEQDSGSSSSSSEEDYGLVNLISDMVNAGEAALACGPGEVGSMTGFDCYDSYYNEAANLSGIINSNETLWYCWPRFDLNTIVRSIVIKEELWTLGYQGRFYDVSNRARLQVNDLSTLERLAQIYLSDENGKTAA